MTKRVRDLAIVVLLSSCGGLLHGKGKLFVWNGTDAPLSVKVEGPSDDEFTLAPNTGHLDDSAVAGSYKVIAQREDGEQVSQDVELEREKIDIVNLGAATCFARADISGMYQSGKERNHLIQSYHADPVIQLDDILHVFPGEPAPNARPKSLYAFQRMYPVPCDHIDDNTEVSEYLRNQR